MSVRNWIGIEEEDGSHTYVYCHHGGYVGEGGRLLLESYTTREVVRELLGHGDLSCLEKRINPTGPHSFLKPEADVCIFYGRDRGETGVAAQNGRIPTDEISYLMDKNGTWKYRRSGSRTWWTLASVLQRRALAKTVEFT